jgi:hypothetical protein
MAIPSQEAELPLWEEGTAVHHGVGMGISFGRVRNPLSRKSEERSPRISRKGIKKGDSRFLCKMDFYIRQLNFYFGQS